MGEFYPNMYVAGDRFLNFSDARPKDMVIKDWGYEWGKLSGSEIMTGFWCQRYNGVETTCISSEDTCYKFFYSLCGETIDPDNGFTPATSIYYESLKLGIMREYANTDKGFYLAMLGAHNPHSHTHADLGTIWIFHDGKPVFIDAGTGRYTRLTFSAERNNLWWIRSDHHNLPTINGKMQGIGTEYVTSDAVYDKNNKTFSLDLKGAYPADAEIDTYKRIATLGDGQVTITDIVKSNIDGEIQFNYLLNEKPEFVEDGVFTVHGVKVKYDRSLAFSYDCPDVTMPETVDMPIEWECDKLYRVSLIGKLEANKQHKYNVTVTK